MTVTMKEARVHTMENIVSIKDMPTEFKIALLNELGYNSDGVYVTDKKGNQVLDRYTKDPVKIDNMAIMPGSTIILDDNPLSIIRYLDEFE